VSSSTIGIISDTHGTLYPLALQALEGVDAIIHAGDIVVPEHISQLAAIAPLTIVRGNMDRAAELARIPLSQTLRIGGADFYVIHILEDLDIDPATAGFAAVVFGHSHVPICQQQNGLWMLNPGSASYPRGGTRHSLMRVGIQDRVLTPVLIEL
jgi:hypothetical protein